MTAEEALEIIVDLLEKAGPNKIQRAIGSRILLDDIETIAISYEEMDYEIERDMVDDEGRFEGPNLMTTITSSIRPSPWLKNPARR